MIDKKRGLGRGLADLGLNELLSDKHAHTTTAPTTENTATPNSSLAIDDLQPGKYQPRREMDFDSLQELADSIKAQGIIQPIVIRPIENNQYEIIAGERRWRAARIAGLTEVPVVIRDIPDDAAIAMALIENIQREDLNPVEEAIAIERFVSEFDLKHEEVANLIGKSRTNVTNLLRLLHCEADVKMMLINGDIEKGHALVLLSLKEQQQTDAAKQIVEKGLSVRATEQLVKRLQAPAKLKKEEALPDTSALENALNKKFNLPMKIKSTGKKGTLVIQFNRIEELEALL
jgi:ParB family chromosome partitioning protein